MKWVKIKTYVCKLNYRETYKTKDELTVEEP